MKIIRRLTSEKSRMSYQGPAYRAPLNKDGKQEVPFNLVTLPGTQWVSFGTEEDGSPKLILVDKMSGRPLEPHAIAKLMKIMGSEAEVDKCKIALIMTQSDITDLILKVKKACKEEYEKFLNEMTEKEAATKVDVICKAKWEEEIQPMINKAMELEKQLRDIVKKSKLPKDNVSVIDAERVLGEKLEVEQDTEDPQPAN